MCEPTLIIAGISAVASLYAQKQAADSQNDSNQRQYTNTLAARAENANQIGLARSQAAQGATEKINANETAMREAQSTVRAQGGPSGLSVDALLAHIGGKGASYNDSVNQNFQRVNEDLNSRLTNVNRGASTEINALKTPAQPDYLGTALRIGNAAYGKYGPSYQSSPGVDSIADLGKRTTGIGD